MRAPRRLPLSRDLQRKAATLRACFHGLDGTLVAFSGGVDSTLVLKIAVEVLGPRATAVTAASPTLPREELDAVRHLSREIGARLIVAPTNQLAIEAFVRNDARRCYHCKTDLYRLLAPIQRDTGMATIVDGAHVDDLSDDRPGMQAAREFGVRSPLVEAGFRKPDVRALAHALGLSNWDKPAAACLSSRIPRGTRITAQQLLRVERAERVLKEEGFRQVRVRDHDGLARIEVDRDDLPEALDPVRRDRITRGLNALGFHRVTVDPEGYRPGGGT